MIIKNILFRPSRYVVLILPFLLTACWKSERQLFDESLMVDPFGNAKAYVTRSSNGKMRVFIKRGRSFETISEKIIARYNFIPAEFKSRNTSHSYFLVSSQTRSNGKTSTTGLNYTYGYIDGKNAWHNCLLSRKTAIKVNTIRELKTRAKNAFIKENSQQNKCGAPVVPKAISFERAHLLAKQIRNNENIAKAKKSNQNNKRHIQTGSHAHAGRVHSHPLPKQGIRHKHGNGAIGQHVGKTGKRTTTNKKKGVPKRPRPPINLNGYYLIGKSGEVTKFSQSGSRIRTYIELPSKFSRDAGYKRGHIESRGSYSPASSTLSIQGRITIVSNKNRYRHCGAIFANNNNYEILPIRFKDGSYSANAWQVQSRSGRICSSPQVKSSTCRMVGCSKYRKVVENTLIVKNRERAMNIGSQRQRTYKGGKSYSEIAAETRRNNRRKAQSGWSASEDARKFTDDVLTDWWLSN